MPKKTPLRPFLDTQIHTLEHAVQELQDKVQKLKHRIQDMEIDSRQCERMLQDNYDRYDPRAPSSKNDRMNKVMRGNHDVAEREQQEQRERAWQLFLFTPYGDGSAQASKHTRRWIQTH